MAVAFYKLVKALEYETVNPGQDATKVREKEAEVAASSSGDLAHAASSRRTGAPRADDMV